MGRFTEVGGGEVRTRSPVTAVLLAVALTAALSFSEGSYRMPGDPRRDNRKSIPCTECARGRLRRQADGTYWCRKCGHHVFELPKNS